MSQEEQQAIQSKGYAEAIRYMDNAKETLKKAGKEDYYYNDRKYVRMASGAAYNGALIALDTYLILKGIKKAKGRKSIDYYNTQIVKIDKKLLKHLGNVYDVLHLSGYYDGVLDARVIQAGLDEAYKIIEYISPVNNNNQVAV
ncbi:MAG: DUF5618 family protein [Dysgonamonadaceae bacterium]|jgi:tRNA G37 N-methylase TrmD|nr:DUF5618 family protein [Dysgonamonadaceae bacterium]